MKYLYLLSIILLTAACTSTQKVLESGELQVGQSKKEGSDLFLLSFGDNPFLCECGDYYEDLEIEILPNENRNIFLVYEDVTRPLRDFVDDIGNGRLLGFYNTYEEAYAVIEEHKLAEKLKEEFTKEIAAQKREEERALRQARAESQLAEINRAKEKKKEKKMTAKKKKEQERILRIKENFEKLEKYKTQRLTNSANKKIINAIKFALYRDKATWYSADIPVSKQNYSFEDCIYTTWDVEDGTLYQWDFNKIKWKAKSTRVEQNWVFLDKYHSYIDYDCEGKCRIDGNYKYSRMSFETVEGFRTRNALQDIKNQCRGFHTPY